MAQTSIIDETSPSPERPNPQALLESFVRGKNSERAFRQLAEHFGGLIHASALRRTNDLQLAEEITQNVLAILARKAPALLSHPSLTGWVFQTTRLESSKAMRTEQRRRAKHHKLAQEIETEPSEHTLSFDASQWKEATPLLDQALDQMPEKDREVILLRFFDGLKFREIAAARGLSEAACKMQLKRALEKLSILLKTKGTSLSFKTLTAGLGIQLLGSNSAQAASLLAPKALAAASSVGPSTLLSNTLLTMSITKKTVLLSALLLTTGSIPAILQAVDNSRLQNKLSMLQQTQENLQKHPLRNSSQNSTVRSGSQTVHDLLNAQNQSVNAAELLKEYHLSRNTLNRMGTLKVMLPVTNLSPEELAQLLVDVQEYDGFEDVKPTVVELLAEMAGEFDSEEREKQIEKMLSLGITPRSNSFSSTLTNWAEENPEAAFAWFREKQKTGELSGTGVYNNPEEAIFSDLIRGVAGRDLAQAVEAYLSQEQPHLLSAGSSAIVRPLAKESVKTGDLSLANKLIEGLRTHQNRSDMAANFAREYTKVGGNVDEAFALVQPHMEHLAVQAAFAQQLASYQRDMSFEDSLDWVYSHRDQKVPLEFTTSNFISKYLSTYSDERSTRAEKVVAWVDQQPSGAVREKSLIALSKEMTKADLFEDAYQQAERIETGPARKKAMTQVASAWLEQNKEEAQNHLPPELLENENE